MIHLAYSNRTEELVPALIRNIRKHRGGAADVFTQADVIIPNKNMETFLRHEIAARQGIAANLNCTFLEKYLARLVSPGEEVQILGREELGFLLLTMLQTGSPHVAASSELGLYLTAAGHAQADVDLRRFQLAEKVGELFKEYSYSRADMLEHWRNGKLIAQESRFASAERWQAALWRGLLAEKENLAGPCLTLQEAWAELAQSKRGAAARLDIKTLGRHKQPVHVFGLSYMAGLFHEILSLLGTQTEVYVYALNPCAEFWEDVETVSEQARRERFSIRGQRIGAEAMSTLEDPFQLERESDETGAADNPALRLWGRPGRENIRLLNELTDCAFEPLFSSGQSEEANPANPSLLRRLQNDILLREPAGPKAMPEAWKAQDDASIRVLACPGLQREVEVLANEIWRLIEESRGAGVAERLRFNEIAVIVNHAQKDLYHSQIPAVFEALHGIPHTIADRSLAAENRVGEALDLLFRLPLGNFSRGDMLRLMTHPLLCGPRGDEELGATAAAWRDWCARLNIIFGADATDLAGTYLEDEDLLNWDQGLRRLTLGAFMAGEPSGRVAPFVQNGKSYLPEEFPAGELEAAARFTALARSLLADARYCRSASLTLSEWAAFLAGAADAYFDPAGDDENVLARCVHALQSLEETDMPALPAERRRVSYRVAVEYARAAVEGIAGRGRYLSDGVVVSSFLPMRAIPFKVVFLLGLGEGLFPGGATADPLDLRGARRRAGDVSMREKDKYMFLETLLSVRERIYLSYVSRDGLTGETLRPSTVIQELQSVLADYLPPEQDVGVFTRKHPLARHDDLYFSSVPRGDFVNYSPTARKEAQAAALREELHAYARANRLTLPEDFVLEAELSPVVAARIRARFNYPVPPSGVLARGLANRVPFGFTALRNFLECPLQGSARMTLGLREEDTDDVLLVEDEAFAASPLSNATFLQTVFLAAEGRLEKLEAVYDEKYPLEKWKGNMPAGFFARIQREKHDVVFQAWRSNLDILGIESLAGYEAYRFGAANEFADAGLRFDPVLLPSQDGGALYELSGATALLSPARDRCLVLLNRNKPNDKDFFKGFWTLVMLAAAGVALPELFEVVIVQLDDVKKKIPVHRFKTPTTERSQAFLREIIADVEGRAHDYLLPIEAVFKMEKALGDDAGDEEEAAPEEIESLSDIVRDVIDGGMHSSNFGPVRAIERFDPPSDEDCAALVRRRFSLWKECKV